MRPPRAETVSNFRTFYQDESGRDSDWCFVMAEVTDPRSLVEPIRSWRKRFYGSGSKRCKRAPQEYRDADASPKQRAFMAGELASKQIKIWAIVKKGYRPEEYPLVISELIRMAGADCHSKIFLDLRDNRKRRLRDKEHILSASGQPELAIDWLDSVQSKEIQACDALAGIVLRHHLDLRGEFGVIEACLAAEVVVLGEDHFENRRRTPSPKVSN